MAQTSKQEADEGVVHELEDLVVQEVSSVDRGANKKVFAIVKEHEMSEQRGKRVVSHNGRSVTEVATPRPTSVIKQEDQQPATSTSEGDVVKDASGFGLALGQAVQKMLTASKTGSLVLSMMSDEIWDRWCTAKYMVWDAQTAGPGADGTMDEILAEEFESIAGLILQIARAFRGQTPQGMGTVDMAKSEVERVTKAGKALSKKNLSALKKIHGDVSSAMGSIQGVESAMGEFIALFDDVAMAETEKAAGDAVTDAAVPDVGAAVEKALQSVHKRLDDITQHHQRMSELFKEYVDVGEPVSQALSDDPADDIQKAAGDDDDGDWPLDFNAKGPEISFGGRRA